MDIPNIEGKIINTKCPVRAGSWREDITQYPIPAINNNEMIRSRIDFIVLPIVAMLRVSVGETIDNIDIKTRLG